MELETKGVEMMHLKIGVLALQGAFIEHVQIFRKLGVEAMEVRKPDQLAEVDGLVIPGGESTAISFLAERWKLMEPLKEWVATGKPTWGTCAGMIMLAKNVTGKMKQGQLVLGGLDATVHRNYFGSQLGSFVAELDTCDSSLFGIEKHKAVFIRAPVIAEAGENVKVLATIRKKPTSVEAAETAEQKDSIVAVRQGYILATSFHPELTEDHRWHEAFLSMVIEYHRNK